MPLFKLKQVVLSEVYAKCKRVKKLLKRQKNEHDLTKRIKMWNTISSLYKELSNFCYIKQVTELYSEIKNAKIKVIIK